MILVFSFFEFYLILTVLARSSTGFIILFSYDIWCSKFQWRYTDDQKQEILFSCQTLSYSTLKTVKLLQVYFILLVDSSFFDQCAQSALSKCQLKVFIPLNVT